MPTEASKPASDRQIAYIKSLRAELGGNGSEISHEMTSFEASKLISELIAKAQKNGAVNGQAKNVRINEPRLGMAMKECFRQWAGKGWDVYGKDRTAFIKDVIETYSLFTEIASVVDQNRVKKA
ncbi:MAG: hypothetical protein SWQ30_19200 [Thermodesulfobacteriota bacterium]|nr:hypothetical protein [Thermodesulfobacteriota bacterium]